MGILNWLKKKENKEIKKEVNPGEEYILSTLIHVDYLTCDNPILYILFTFSNSYCSSAIDIVNLTYERSIYIQSSDEINIENDNEDENNTIEYVAKNYLLCPLRIDDICLLINNIDISNPFLNEIIQEIYENINSSYFSFLTDKSVINKSLFLDKDVDKQHNMCIMNNNGKEIIYNDISAILKKLPSEFTGIDLFFIFWFKCYYNSIQLKNIHLSYMELSDYEMGHVYNAIIKNPSLENLEKLNMPLYKRSIDEDELIHGDLNSHEVDQIFQEQYDRFNAIVNDNVSYMDIDEVLSEEDPEYNNLQNNDTEEY